MPSRHLLVAAALLAAVSVAGCTSSGGSPKPSGTAGSTTAGTSSSPVVGPTAPTTAASTATSTAAKPLATFTALGGRATTMRFDPTFVRALFSRSITTRASGDTRLTAIGEGSQIVLPITAGHVTMYAGSAAGRTSGVLQTSGSGLRLGNADGVTVRIDAFTATLGSGASISAQLETQVDGATGPAKPVTLFALRATRPVSSLRGGVGTLGGYKLYLTAAAAKALDAALETTAFTGASSGLYVGTVSFAMTRA